MSVSEFNQLALSPELQAAIKELGYLKMTAIQAAAIPPLLAGHDVIGRSKTGSGKTATFALPILQKIGAQDFYPQALILCPTRELSEQVLQEIKKFSKNLKQIKSVALVGGQPYPAQIQALESGVQIVVGTPGRTLELLKSEKLDVRDLKTFVLDEADRLLDEGFSEEITQIINLLPTNRQTVFFSATFPESVEKLSRQYQKNPQTVTIEQIETVSSITQYLYQAENPEKIETLIRILKQHPSDSTLIFCRTKKSVDEISQLLTKNKVPCRPLHADLEQGDRDQAMALFRSRSLRVLIATDIAARGIDIDHLELVINFDLPATAEIYLHRIGRAGRAGRKGEAVSIANLYEVDTGKVLEIEKITGHDFIKKPLGFKNELILDQQMQSPKSKTILISAGKKDRVSKGDILGALTATPGPVESKHIGSIQVEERVTFVAISLNMANKALSKLQQGKIKGLKVKAYFVDP